jgi:hypothetical protein
VLTILAALALANFAPLDPAPCQLWGGRFELATLPLTNAGMATPGAGGGGPTFHILAETGSIIDTEAANTLVTESAP